MTARRATTDDLSKYEWRPNTESAREPRAKDNWQRLVTLPLGGFGATVTMVTLAEKIAKEDLEDAVIEAKVENDYGDISAEMFVKGWKRVSDEDVVEALREIDAYRARCAAQEERQAAALRKSRPDLFQ